jgi:predicted nucleotidyltransferase
MPVVHEKTAMPADIVLAGPGLEDLFLSRAAERDVGGAVVPVVAAEDLVVMKILAGRDKDKADVRAVLQGQRGKVDLQAIRETLRMVEEALSQNDLIPLFEELSRSK